jgi:hypothetical protein
MAHPAFIPAASAVFSCAPASTRFHMINLSMPNLFSPIYNRPYGHVQHIVDICCGEIAAAMSVFSTVIEEASIHYCILVIKLRDSHEKYHHQALMHACIVQFR